MRSTLIQEEAPRMWALVFDPGGEVMAGLAAFVERETLGASALTAIGAFTDARLGWFDRARREYREIPVDEQVEVLALVGDVAHEDGKPVVHAHVVVGRQDGTALGGHLLEAHVDPTLEVIVTETPAHLRKRHDPATGLALIDLAR